MRPIDADAMRQDWLENGEDECIYDTNAVLDSIDSQPTVNQWIPVTERLPKPLEKVLILAQKNGKSHVSVGQYSRLAGMWYTGEYSTHAKITHWTPMPKEYIDREYYCNNICRCHETECDKTKCPLWTAPTADVAPVVHGEWISDGDGYCWCYKCSVCGWKDGYPFNDRHKFCPNCGAKMKEEQ